MCRGRHLVISGRSSGANIALRDAELLAAKLTARPENPVAAIADYETQLRDYGFTAVLDSQQANARFHRKG